MLSVCMKAVLRWAIFGRTSITPTDRNGIVTMTMTVGNREVFARRIHDNTSV